MARTPIFSSYRGEDDLGSYEVLFDVDPTGSEFIFPSLRACIHSTCLQSCCVNIVRDKYQHFAMTYDDGDVTLYFEGQQVGSGRVVPGGPVYSYYELRLGQYLLGTPQEQFGGYVDDILILPEALNEADIKVLHDKGAEVYLAGVELAKMQQLST